MADESGSNSSDGVKSSEDIDASTASSAEMEETVTLSRFKRDLLMDNDEF